MLKIVYDTFGLTYKMALSTRPAERLGDDALWDQAEGALQGALDATGQDWEVSQSSASSGIVGLFRNRCYWDGYREQIQQRKNSVFFCIQLTTASYKSHLVTVVCLHLCSTNVSAEHCAGPLCRSFVWAAACPWCHTYRVSHCTCGTREVLLPRQRP